MTMDFQSRSLLSLDLPSYAYTSNGVQLLVDGDMEAVGVAAWTLVAGTSITKQPSTLPGSTQCLRLTGGVNSYFRQTAAFSAAGRAYRIRGWARGDGIAAVPGLIDTSGAVQWRGTSSNTWQYIDVQWTAVGILYWELYTGGGYVEFDNFVIEWAPASTRNLGTLSGYAQLGDGYTAASFPTQVFPHGMSFDGSSDYLQVANSGDYNFTAGGGVDLPFSCELFIKILRTVTSSLFTKANGGGWAFFMSGASPLLSLTSSAGNYLYATAAVGARVPTVGSVTHVIVSYTGSGTVAGINLYTDGSAVAKSTGSLGVYAGLPGGVTPLTLCKDFPGLNYNQCVIYNAAIYPFALQPGEVAQLYQQRRSLIQRGF